MIAIRFSPLLLAACLCTPDAAPAQQPALQEPARQQTARLSGQVSIEQTGGPLHGAHVSIVELDLSTLTDDAGAFSFDNVPPGEYHVVAHLDSMFTEVTRVVTVVSGHEAKLSFSLALSEQRYEITVTASDKPQTPFESFNSVESLDAYDLSQQAAVSLGETLDHQVGTGIAKRSFGPGSSRPIIRGFDGDRVLVMEDGVRSGTLSAQSGDHGELINPAQLERLEIVKGPATLLYSGSAVGGTVNAISRHHELHQHPHEGLRGFISTSAGSASSLGGASAGFEYGLGKWMLWGRGGGVRAGDYNAPSGKIFNSRSHTSNGGGGFGRYGARSFFSVDVKFDDGSNGVPFAQDFEGDGSPAPGEPDLERVTLDSRRQNYRFNWGLKDLGRVIQKFALKLNYTDWSHDEVESFSDGSREIGTTFDQQQFIYRGVFEQVERGPLGGRFGFWGLQRSFDVAGEEALSPPVDQTGFALFVLEELTYERVKFQFGGRLETERYTPGFAERSDTRGSAAVDAKVPDAVNRNFTGGSAAAGIHAEPWKNGAVVVNYAHTYRAPALEELYNFGPHVGNLAFEIGDPHLSAETGDGVDLSVRHRAGRVQGELNLFYYRFSNFVFPFDTGEKERGLRVIEFTQRRARFTGAEAVARIRVRSDLQLNLGMDFVDAQDTESGTPLPRIPPLRGKVGVNLTYHGLRFTPELIVANQQHQTFTGETRTPGYAVVNLKAAYSIAQQHRAHLLSLNVFNVGDRLYRNHSSFIKDLAPEIGRGVRLTYSVRFF